MRAIAERRICGALALAEKAGFRFFRRKGERCEVCAAMRAITKRLLFGTSAPAPVIGLASFEIDFDWLFGCNNRICHRAHPSEFSHHCYSWMQQEALSANAIWCLRCASRRQNECVVC